jgi:hypothetical protein
LHKPGDPKLLSLEVFLWLWRIVVSLIALSLTSLIMPGFMTWPVSERYRAMNYWKFLCICLIQFYRAHILSFDASKVIFGNFT